MRICHHTARVELAGHDRSRSRTLTLHMVGKALVQAGSYSGIARLEARLLATPTSREGEWTIACPRTSPLAYFPLLPASSYWRLHQTELMRRCNVTSRTEPRSLGTAPNSNSIRRYGLALCAAR
jgi:hypothetical protein